MSSRWCGWHPALLSLLLLLLLQNWTIRARIVLRNSQSTNNNSTLFDAPTINYFQASRARSIYHFHNATFLQLDLLPYLPSIDSDVPTERCSISTNLSSTTTTSNNNNNSSVVVAIRDSAFYLAGCRTLAQLAQVVKEYESTLLASDNGGGGYGSVGLVLLLLEYPHSGVPLNVRGGPHTEPYRSRSVSYPDGDPALPMAMLDPADTVRLLDQLAVMPTGWSPDPGLTAEVTYEPGPWNDYFSSSSYFAAIYTLLIINLTYVIYTGFVATERLVNGQMRRDRKSAILMLIMLAAVLLITELPLSIAILPVVLLRYFNKILFTAAFFLLLYTWCDLFAILRPSYWTWLQRTFIASSGLLIIINCGVTLIDALIYIHTDTRALLRQVVFYLIFFTYLLNVLLFTYFGMVFRLTRHRYRRDSATYQALLRLGYIGIGAFLTLLLVVPANLLVRTPTQQSTPMLVMTAHLLRMVGNTIRSIALLYIGSASNAAQSTDDDNDGGVDNGDADDATVYSRRERGEELMGVGAPPPTVVHRVVHSLRRSVLLGGVQPVQPRAATPATGPEVAMPVNSVAPSTVNRLLGGRGSYHSSRSTVAPVDKHTPIPL